MKYLRKHNVNPFNLLDDTILQRSDGNIDLNPTQRVRINGDLEFAPGVSIPGPVVTNVMYVTMDGDDANDGTGEGPNQAKRTLKSACAVAQEGTTIYVRSGEYYENNPITVPPRVSIIGDNLRNTILRPLNGTSTYTISNVSRTNNIVTIATVTAHGFVEGDRVRVTSAIGSPVAAGFFVIGQHYTITTVGDTAWTTIGAPSSTVGTSFYATGSGSGTGYAALADVDETDVNIFEIVDDYTFTYRQSGVDISSTPSTGTIKKGSDFFLVNSATYIAQLVIKGLQAPAYCVNMDSDAIVDTSPYIQNCSNINGPWLKNGTEWLPFQTEQPDINGVMVTGPRPLRDDEIDPAQVEQYAVDVTGAGGGMLIDGDRYSTQSPIKSMVADAFTQVCQGGVGFHVSNFGYMQLVSCFAVFCSKGFYTTRGGYLSVSNSVCDFGDQAFLADGFYLDPYASGSITADYYSSAGSVTVNNEGSGYSVAPTATIDPPTSPGGIQAEAEVSIDPILGIINAITITNPGSGYDFQPNIIITPALNGAAATVNLAKNLTIDVSELSDKPQVGSIMFLGNDTNGYYISATSNSNLTFKYDETKCRRDVAIILDAVLSDAVFNSNHRTVYSGLSYLRSYSSKVTSLQKSQTIAGLQQAKAEAISLTSNTTLQNRINDNFNIVINIINLGISVAPSISIPAQTATEPGFAEAAAILIANKTFIQDELEAWIALNYPTLTYNIGTCRRDVAYITDALAYDLTYEGNTATSVAATAYAAGNVISGQVEETQAAYEYWKTIVSNIVKNIAITRSAGNTTTQNTSLPIGSPVDPDSPANTASSLLQIVIDVIDHGTGYIPDPTIDPNFSSANDPVLVSERETILDSTIPIQEAVIEYLNGVYGGTVTVATFPPVQSVTNGTLVKFHNVSTISTASTALEYVGAGVTYNALPFFGGEPIPANERVEYNNGKCFTVTSDQIGNYRIGQYFTVNALTGEVTIDAENINLSGLAAIGPFKRNGIPVGVQLREVSNNSNLIASTGFADVNTVPTQPAVQTYVENRYLNKVSTSASTIAGNEITFTGDIAVNGGDIYSTAATFNLLNRDSSGSIAEDGPETINAFLNATSVTIGAATGQTTIKHGLEVQGSFLSSTQATVNLLNEVVGTVNAFGDATTITLGDTTGSVTIKNPTINFTNATAVNIDGVNPTIASTSTGTLTLFDTLITTVNAFGAATTISIGESTGTLTIKSANTVVNGDLQVKGGDITTDQTTFNLLNTTATTVNAFGAATALGLGAGSGTTTVGNNLQVNLNTTLGVDATSANIYWGTFTANIRDNVTSSLEIKEATNSYIKIDTANSAELTSFGSIAKVAFNNVTDASSTTVASTTFAGGVGIAKNLYVGTNLNISGSTTLGDDRTADTHAVNGTLVIDVPDNTAIAFQVKENTQTYITAVTTDDSESVTIESTPKLLVKNTTDSTDKDTGAVIVEGGVGIEKNLTVGVDLKVDRDGEITGDLAVNGGDLTTTAETFNLINGNATTVNFAGAGTDIQIGAATGTTNINHNLDVDGDVNINGGDLTVSTATFNLANTTATTLNFAGVATAVNIGTDAAAASVLTLGASAQNNNEIKINNQSSGTVKLTSGITTGTVDIFTSVTGTTNIASSGDIKLGSSASAVTTVTVGGAITGNTLKIAGTAAGAVNLTTDVTTGSANIFTSVTGNINIGAADTTVNIGETTGNSTLEVRGNISSGIATVTTNAGTATANIFNTNATTVNFAGAATTIEIGAATGTTNINHNLDVDGDVNIDGGDLTVSTTTFNLANTTATTGNMFGAATGVNIGISAAAASTMTFGPAITGNTFKLASTTDGTINLTTDVTSGIANIFSSVSGTTNIADAGTINLGKSSSLTTTVDIGGAITGNQFKISGIAAGAVTVTSDVTTGTVDLFNNVTTGTVNIAGAGASVINLGGAGSTVNAKTLTLTTDLEVQYGGSGRSTFTENGVIFGNNADGLLVTAASNPGSNATTSYGVLTTDINNVPVWTDVIDGGSY